MARFSQLEDWLAWQEKVQWPSINPSLARVGAVLRRMALERPPFRVVTVGGTNGKGSTVAMLESILLAAGCRVGSYTSPHLLRYNERIKVQGAPVTDAAICRAFSRIDTARGDISLTYFEFGTLAAIDIFHQAGLDVALLEVGLGGRLDAVNSLDADVAAITTVGIDHVKWLGTDREAIGWEKAGIFRSHRPAVCGDLEPPASLAARASELATPLYRPGRDFHRVVADEDWTWRSKAACYAHLPRPALHGDYQYQNAATALMVLQLLAGLSPPVTEAAAQRGLNSVSLPGRLQRLPGAVERFLDVAHNPQGARAFARALRSLPCRGRTHAVFGMLADKDAAGVAASLQALVDIWYLGGLEGERGLSGKALAEKVSSAVSAARLYPTVEAAYREALQSARPGDRVLVLGSFQTVEAALRLEGLGALPVD